MGTKRAAKQVRLGSALSKIPCSWDSAFPRRERLDRQRMHLAAEEIRERLVDHAVTLDARFAGEGGSDDAHAEMTLAGPWRGCVSRMTMRIVHHLQRDRREGGCQFCANRIFDAHRSHSTLHPSPFPPLLALCARGGKPSPTRGEGN